MLKRGWIYDINYYVLGTVAEILERSQQKSPLFLNMIHPCSRCFGLLLHLLFYLILRLFVPTHSLPEPNMLLDSRTPDGAHDAKWWPYKFIVRIQRLVNHQVFSGR